MAKKFHQRQHRSYEKTFTRGLPVGGCGVLRKMIGYRRSSEMIRYMPAGHASKLTKILRASPQRNFKLDKEKAPMAQPQSNELQGENITNERRLHSQTPDDNRSTWTHGRWINEFLKGRGDIYTGVTLTIATTSITKNREPRWPPY